MAKTVKDLIKEMNNNEKLSKEVFADPKKFKAEYNLSDAAVQALSKMTYSEAVQEASSKGKVEGGCYYGG